MKTPFFKAWQWVFLVSSVASVGAGFKVAGETISSTGQPGTTAAATGTAATTLPPMPNATGAVDSFGPSTNNLIPADLKVSPDLAEIIKLAQAGLSEDVMMAYISNSVRVFNLGSDEIIYLNDLGVSAPVITAMIQQDTSPASAARKLAGNEPSPLPPGVALNSPATNVYPAQQTPVLQPEESPVEPEAQAPAATPYAVSDYTPQPEAVPYFYTALAPYGNWVQIGGYGLCWQPTVAWVNRSWRPYCDRGRWVYSDCGWYWLSDYSWGWAPFHYGRWVCNANFGWVWAPDCTWGPAWVSWRYSGNYCGWAPLPPEAGFTLGVGFTFHHRAVGFDCEFGLRARHYNFIPFDRFCDYSPSRYRVAPAYVNNLYNQTRIVNNVRVMGNNTLINEGFDPAHVTAVTHSEIRRVAIRDTTAPTGRPVKYDHLEREGNKLVVFRPQLPTPTPSKPVPSGGRAIRPNRQSANVRASIPEAGLVTLGPKASLVISGSSPASLAQGNTAGIRPPLQQDVLPTKSLPETEKPRVTVIRSSSGLTIRGEPRRPQISPVGETASNQIRVSSPVQVEARTVTEPAQPANVLPVRSHFSPVPPPFWLPNRVEGPNHFQSRSQFAQSEYSARPAQPSFSPPPVTQSSAPSGGHVQHQDSPRGHSQNSNRGDQKR